MGRVKVAIYACSYLTASLVCIAWYEVAYRKAEVPFYYWTPPGIMMGMMRGAAMFWFYYASYTTRSNFGTKKRFYAKVWRSESAGEASARERAES